MKIPALLTRRVVPWPTRTGWLIGVFLLFAPPIWWLLEGEAFLSPTERLPADILVVESWVGPECLRAAAQEFKQYKYQYIAATGGLTGRDWSEKRWRLSDGAKRELTACGIPEDKIILADDQVVEEKRTFAAANSVSHALQAAGITPHSVNVFTISAHTRRSRLVYAKVLGSQVQVGSIAWAPPSYGDVRWWHSSSRTSDFLKESIAYAFELVLNSGRWAQGGKPQPTSSNTQAAGADSRDSTTSLPASE